jgi:hypothetical protein
MTTQKWIHRAMIATVAFTLCGGPQLLAAQESAQPQTVHEPTTPQTSAQQQDQNLGTTPNSATPDPSKGPLQPSQSVPDAPSATTQPTPNQTQNAAPQTEGKETPLGTAAAQGVKTSGGAASRPAGTAIAPAKQHQSRSLFIKIAAVAAGAAALGAVYGLTRSSPSTPPGAKATTATPQR